MLELIVSVVSLALALASVRDIPWRRLPPAFIAGLAAGYLLIPTIPEGLVLGPVLAMLGVLLIGSNRWVSPLIVPMTAAVGGMSGYAVKYPGIPDFQVTFLEVLLAVGAAVSVILLRKHYRDWYAIPRRIGGSWLLAAGSLLLALFLRSPDLPVTASGMLTPPIHDPNQPHIHGPNGEIIYLSTGRKEQAALPSKNSGILPGLSTNQTVP